MCYDPNEITNGFGGQNTYTYHICLVGSGSFTAEQEKAWDDRVAHNMARLNIGVANVKGHREMPGANTSCPGIDMNVVRSRISSGTKTVTTPKPQTGGTQVGAKPAPKPAPKPSNSTTLRRGSKGSEVTALQKRLLALGYKLPQFGADGDFGKETEDAVKAFQKDANIGVDGIAGPQTVSALDKVEKAKPTKEYVNLPASVQTWRTYKTNVAPVAKNSDWSLTPAKFGGLTYEVLARPQADVVTINTSRGKRNIYVAKSTGATFTRK